MAATRKFIPLIIAAPMFLQNVDMMATSVALPDMARSLGVVPLQLNLVIAAYAVSLAVFLPISAWLVDRFGAKRMFCSAILIFSGASALCGMAQSATLLIICRVLQGFGAALMVPVGRLILLRTVPASELMAAMVWFTLPPTIGRLLGPLIGGAIISIASWRWIFLVNIPLGLIAILLAIAFVDADTGEAKRRPFDSRGFALMGIGLGATLGGIEAVSRGLVSSWTSYAFIGTGVVSLLLYIRYSLRVAAPVIDLRILTIKTFRINVVGAFPMRLANTAVPFLVPLMLQLGFGMKPLDAGLMSSGVAAGALGTRLFMKRAMRRVSFRSLFLGANLMAALMLGAYGLLVPTMPHSIMFGIFFVGGLTSSLCLVSLNTIGFVDVPPERMAHATALVAMAQQTASAIGVVFAATLLGIFSRWHGGDAVHLAQGDFSATFFAIGLLSAVSLIPFSQLHPDEGKELR
ncbi:drug resistance transporter, EmrB/QacA subfamily [Sphingobium sp. AP50]|nr:drug resistance transporter, EmrB/QacA subfamily [Sphingobium sp. AP50]